METKNYNWYTMNGVEGIIADEANPKFAGKKHIAQCGGYVFIPLSEFDGIDIDEDDTILEYYDSYEPEPCNIGEEIVCESVVHIDNEQCLVETFVNKDLYLDDLYTREICTLTDRYYMWESELSKFVDECIDLANKGKFYKNTAKEEWNKIEGKYHDYNQFNEVMTFGKVMDIVEQYI